MNENGMSPADIAAMMGNNGNNGFGMGGWGIFIIILLLATGGFNGFGQHGLGGAATAAAQNEILLGQQFSSVENKLNEIGNGLCNSTYALNTAITGEGRAIQTQIAQCCCDNRVGMANLEAKIDQQTGIFTNMVKDVENQRLRERVNTLERNEALCGVVRYPMGFTYAASCNPFCGPQCGCGGNYQPNI